MEFKLAAFNSFSAYQAVLLNKAAFHKRTIIWCSEGEEFLDGGIENIVLFSLWKVKGHT